MSGCGSAESGCRFGSTLDGVTNVELDPAEVVCKSRGSAGAGDGSAGFAPLEILEPRDVPLGGLRAMTVRRTLPQKSRSLIGAWCFADHYGPQQVADTGGMTVAPHPHTGLQTVSWLFAGEIEHRDSIGSHAMVRPGELNLMTAGAGIAHSEVSTPETTVLHGVQLWVALPDSTRGMSPAFEHVVPLEATDAGVSCKVFIGSWLGQTSPATVHTPLLGAELVLQPGISIELPLERDFEHGVLVDSGDVTVGGSPVGRAALAYLPPGTRTMTLTAGDTPARLVLLGGLPLDEEILMWWNFIGRSHDEIVEYRRQWQAEIAAFAAGEPASTVFGRVDGYPGKPLPAPEMPGVRLRPRPRPAG
jgi:redox-sensitive bicupin YhaK (pirin superfamily)